MLDFVHLQEFKGHPSAVVALELIGEFVSPAILGQGSLPQSRARQGVNTAGSVLPHNVSVFQNDRSVESPASKKTITTPLSKVVGIGNDFTSVLDQDTRYEFELLCMSLPQF